MKSFFKLAVTLSWSKIMALVMMLMAFTLDIYHKAEGSIWMFTVPFILTLVIGKQYLDSKK